MNNELVKKAFDKTKEELIIHFGEENREYIEQFFCLDYLDDAVLVRLFQSDDNELFRIVLSAKNILKLPEIIYNNRRKIEKCMRKKKVLGSLGRIPIEEEGPYCNFICDEEINRVCDEEGNYLSYE